MVLLQLVSINSIADGKYIIYVIMTEMSRDQPTDREVSERDIDRLAEAVMVIRQSGLFSVEPIESIEEHPFSFNMGSMHDHSDEASCQYEMTNEEPGCTKSLLIPPTHFTLHARRSSTPLPRVPVEQRGLPNQQSRDQLKRNVPQRASNSPTVLVHDVGPYAHNEQHASNPSTSVIDPLVYSRAPRVSAFTGSTTKGELSFEAWKFEVKCLMQDKACHKDLLLQSVRRSLKGEASRLAMHLGEDAPLEEILIKLERVYGTVESGTTLLQQFYNSRQEGEESVGAYSCRLEDILNKAIARGAVAREQGDEMLRSKLWTGLKDERIRNATRYKYDCVHDFDVLRAELRAVEQEIREQDKVRGKPPKTQKMPSATYMPQTLSEPSKASDNGDSIKKTLSELMAKVKALEVKVAQQPDTTRVLNKILAKVEKLEEKKESASGSQDGDSKAKGPSRQSNSRGPLPRGGQ